MPQVDYLSTYWEDVEGNMFALVKTRRRHRVTAALIEYCGGPLDEKLETRPFPLPAFITRDDYVYRLYMSRPFGELGARFARYKIVRHL